MHILARGVLLEEREEHLNVCVDFLVECNDRIEETLHSFREQVRKVLVVVSEHTRRLNVRISHEKVGRSHFEERKEGMG